MNREGNSLKDNSAKGAIYGERTNHWGLAFCPDQKTFIFRTIVARLIDARQRRAERVVEHYLATRGLKQTDDAERQIERLLLKADR